MLFCLATHFCGQRHASSSLSVLPPPPVELMAPVPVVVAVGTIDLGKLSADNASQVGDQLTLQATWIGPTREPIIQSQTVK